MTENLFFIAYYGLCDHMNYNLQEFISSDNIVICDRIVYYWLRLIAFYCKIDADALARNYGYVMSLDFIVRDCEGQVFASGTISE